MGNASSVSAGTKITAGILTTLLNDIKAEFKRRDNPYNDTGLGDIADSITIADPADVAGNKILRRQLYEATEMLYYVRAGS